MSTETTVTQEGSTSSKSPVIAGILSWIIPGAGHLYGGLSQRGTYWIIGIVLWYVLAFIGFIFIFGIIMLMISPFVHIIAGVDAYFQTKVWDIAWR